VNQCIEAVIFDSDGTLVDSEGPAIDVLHAMICELGITLKREQADALFLGVHMPQCVQWISSQLTDLPADFEPAFIRKLRVATEVRFRQGLQAMPGASDLLAKLDVPFCVATNGPREKVELTLALTGLRQHFGDHVFCAYDIGFFKPDPGLFLHAAKVLGIAPGRCAVVEDSLPGVLAGLAAGMQVFSLLPSADLPPELVNRVQCFSSLVDLHDYLPMRG
jgi:HAD superfamily hydrolase (TIGR01509 family)